MLRSTVQSLPSASTVSLSAGNTTANPGTPEKIEDRARDAALRLFVFILPERENTEVFQQKYTPRKNREKIWQMECRTAAPKRQHVKTEKGACTCTNCAGAEHTAKS